MLVLILAFNAVEVYGQSDDTFASMYFASGKISFDEKNYDRAIEKCTDAIKEDPNFFDAYVLRGYSYSMKSEYDKAIADFTKAVKLKPNDADAKEALETARKQQTENAQYKIGDRGPAGGIVFYDKENNSDGWRYLEAAPVNLQIANWGDAIIVSGTKDEIGSGKRNTELIIVELNRKREIGRAAQLCRAYTLNGYNDWFLPSKDELYLMYKNLKQKGLGGFGDYIYWSSTLDQTNNNYAWYQNFFDGDIQRNPKWISLYVRAIRAF